MSQEIYKIKLSTLIEKLGLKTFYVPYGKKESLDEIFVTTPEVNRPGLALTGFFDYFAENRLQLLGKAEYKFLEGLSDAERAERLDELFSKNIPAVIITHGLEVKPDVLASAQKYNIPLLCTDDSTSNMMSAIISILNVELAPRISRHGVLVEVYGEGILMIGESGVGKSEAAMELLKRGHRLVADDAVEIKRVSDRTLVGSSPELIRYFIELRGIGIVDVRQIFGMGAVKETEKINLVLSLEAWDETKTYDRLGLTSEYYEILGLKIPKITLPIKPGRNLAIIIEVAAMNNRLKRLGYNAAEELSRRYENATGISLDM